MGISLTDEEAWTFLESSEVGILTSLRGDGSPVALPVWFCVHEQRILIASPSSSLKFRRIRRDPRVSFLAESGQRWVELKAVHVSGTASIVDDPDWDLVDRLLDTKYAGLRTTPAEMPERSKQHYSQRSLLCITATHILSWDNARLRRDLPRIRA